MCSAHTGLDAELYYVRDDVVNHNAMSFTMPVPSETNSLHFTWHSKSKVNAGVDCAAATTSEFIRRVCFYT